MATLHILIPNADSVHDFVGITEEFNFDMDLGDGNRMVDAKSILGILYLGVGKVRNLIVPEERVKLVEEKLSSFLVKE
jgi:hypothetical protein